MCLDPLNSQIALKKYEENYPRFNETRECKLATGLLAKIEEQDVDGFTALIADYDSISPLDSWYTTLLLKVKENINVDADVK